MTKKIDYKKKYLKYKFKLNKLKQINGGMQSHLSDLGFGSHQGEVNQIDLEANIAHFNTLKDNVEKAKFLGKLSKNMQREVMYHISPNTIEEFRKDCAS